MDLHEQVLEEIKKVGEHIDQIEAKAEEQAKLSGKAHEETTAELKKWAETYTELKERQDEIEKRMGRIKEGEDSKKTFAKSLAEAIKEKHEAVMGAKHQGVVLTVKDTMTRTDSLTGEVIAPTRVPGFHHDPERQVHIRQFLQSATTDSDNVRFVVEDAYNDGTAPTGEGTAKPPSDFSLEAKDAPVRKIATHLKVSDEMLADVQGLAGYIATRGTAKYRNVEDQQILYGTGTGNQIRGLTLEAAAFSKALTAPLTNLYDVAIDAQAQLAARNYQASAVLLHPTDWFELLIAKGDGGHYLVPDLIRQGLAPAQLNGVPVIQNTAMSEGDFFIANLAQMATLYDRESVSVRFFEQNEDDAINNLITVVIEGRLALPIYLPNAGVYGDLSEIIADPDAGGGGDG